MPARRVRFVKFRKYRAPVLSVLLHVVALTCILIKFENSQDTSQTGFAPVAIALVSENEVPALPPWPVAVSWHTQANDGAEATLAALSGNVPLLQTSNNFALPDVLPRQSAEPVLLPTPHQMAIPPQASYGRFDPTIFATHDPVKPNIDGHNVTTNNTTSSSLSDQVNAPGNRVGIGKFLKGHFRVRIVTTRDNAYLVVEITDGNMAMRALLDETARHYRANVRYSEDSETYNGSFTAPVLAALP